MSMCSQIDNSEKVKNITLEVFEKKNSQSPTLNH